VIGVACSVKNYGICYKTLIFPELKPQKPKIMRRGIGETLISLFYGNNRILG